jgi:1-acyl-sn-glycerol-3-phosphate acyltransferase
MMRPFASLAREIAGEAIVAFAHLVTAPQAVWTGAPPSGNACIYFANHASHGDFVLIWAVLPAPLRRRSRPVAAAEYWQRGRLRRLIGAGIFNAVLIERERVSKGNDPIEKMAAALDEGSSLILVPEGTRNQGAEQLQPFKGGLYHLAKARPAVELVPVWIDNLNRVMPKGEFLPVPLLCSVRFGAALTLWEDERKADFLDRARQSLLALAPQGNRA